MAKSHIESSDISLIIQINPIDQPEEIYCKSQRSDYVYGLARKHSPVNQSTDE